MTAEFEGIMRDVLNGGNLKQDVRALVRLGTFVIQHYDLLLQWMSDHEV